MLFRMIVIVQISGSGFGKTPILFQHDNTP